MVLDSHVLVVIIIVMMIEIIARSWDGVDNNLLVTRQNMRVLELCGAEDRK